MMRSRFGVGEFFGEVCWSDCGSRAWVARVAGLCCMCFWCTFRTFFFSLKEKWVILTKLDEALNVLCCRFFWGSWMVGLWQTCMGCSSGGSLLHVFLVFVFAKFDVCQKKNGFVG